MSEGLSRAEREAAAYDADTVRIENARLQSRFYHVFACPNSLMLEQAFDERVREWSHGADVLDYGCHAGPLSAIISGYGPASITGIDISRTAIDKARDERGDIGTFLVMDAMDTEFDDASFDFVVGRAILHHLDWDRACTELRRILRPGGHALFIEPLGDNPAAKLYRRLTPAARTTDETPLSRAQLRAADELFGSGEHVFAGFVSTPLGMLSSLVSKNPGNAVMRLADKIDRAVANTPLRYWMRMVMIGWTRSE